MKTEINYLKPDELEKKKVESLRDIAIELKILRIMGIVGISIYGADTLVRWVADSIK